MPQQTIGNQGNILKWKHGGGANYKKQQKLSNYLGYGKGSSKEPATTDTL